MSLTIAVDFDGTIATPNAYNGEAINASPQVNVRSTLKHWVDMGYKVVIFTTRLSQEQNPNHETLYNNYYLLAQWLHANSIMKDVHYHQMTGDKIKADYYIDDNAVRFQDWEHAKEVVANG